MGNYEIPHARWARDSRDLDALRLYGPALRSAQDNGFMYDGAIPCQCAARFHLARGLALAGKAYLEHASACCEKAKEWMVRS